MSSTGRSRNSGSASAGTVDRIAASPRPMPRERSATRGHLLGEFEVGLRPGAGRIVVDDRTAEAGRLTEPHVARNDRVEDQRGEMAAHLGLHVLGELGTRVV